MALPPFPAPRASRRRVLVILGRILLLPLLLALLGGLYACAGAATLRREIRDTPRDPATGIVRGAEPLVLDPPATADAPTTACLLLHGFLGSRRDFADLGERLAAAGFHVEMVLLPGHGTTPVDFRAQTPDSLLAGARGHYRRLRAQYRAVYVVGFSMGGTLATLLAAGEGSVDRLVLASPYYGVTYKWYYGLRPEWWNVLIGWSVPYIIKTDAFVKVNRPEAKKSIFSYRCVPTRGVATLLELGRRARAPEVLSSIHCPTLLVMAEGDDAACPHCARLALSRLARAESRWLDRRNNHHIFWDYDREQAKSAIVSFLTR